MLAGQRAVRPKRVANAQARRGEAGLFEFRTQQAFATDLPCTVAARRVDRLVVGHGRLFGHGLDVGPEVDGGRAREDVVLDAAPEQLHEGRDVGGLVRGVVEDGIEVVSQWAEDILEDP